ncbi:hypothetical protein N185_34225 [Sinorhizobium sp. GW3]|nr:hypothetical protein N185_34225 [Sinorhizobium sp. GW3]
MEGHNTTKLLRRASASRVARVASKGGRSVKIEVAGVLLFQEFPT